MSDAQQTGAPPGDSDLTAQDRPSSPPTKAVSSAGSAVSAYTIPQTGQPGQGGEAFDAGAWRRDYEAVCNKLPKEYTGAAAKLKGQGAATLKDAVKADPADLPHGATWAAMAAEIGPVEWDWDGWLPRGFLTMIASAVGMGKSALALCIAGCYLRGDPWPDGTPYTGDLGAILWCEAEAAQAINLERATAWGLPLDRILTPFPDPLIDISLEDPAHRDAILREAGRPAVKLIVVDSLSGAHNFREIDPQVKEIVAFLAILARSTGKPVLLTHHLRKRGIMDIGNVVTLDMVRGGTQIVQYPREVWALDTPDITDPERRRLAVIKSNMGRYPASIGLEWGDNGLVFGEAPAEPRQETQLDRAKELLLAQLQQGKQAQEKLMADAKGQGISEATLNRAKRELRIPAFKEGARWYWALPVSHTT